MAKKQDKKDANDLRFEVQRVDPEYEERMLQFEIDCDHGKGDAWACHSVGEYLSVVKGDYNKAGKVYEENCTKYKHPPSCFNLGRLFLGGRGLPQSDIKSMNCFDKACKGGHSMACHHMGLLLLYGKDGGYDVEKDTKKAKGILNSACNEGIPDSCYALASHLLRSIPEDPKHKRDAPAAKSLLEKGCARGHGPSCFNLAVMYKKGDTGVPKSEQEFEKYKKMTEDLVEQTGALNWKKGH